MLLNKLDNIGEKTINKIAEMAFKSQIKEAKHLSVQVKTNKNKLSQGILESLNIEGCELKTQKDLKLEKLQITLSNIGVNPLKALIGNVQLTQPSEGKADIVLNEKDMEKAFNIHSLNQQLEKIDIHHHDNLKVTFSQVNCRILTNGILNIEVKLKILNTQTIEIICLTLKPSICNSGQGIFLTEVKCNQGKQFSSFVINLILEESAKILNLDDFVMDGISLNVNDLTMEEGKFNLFAMAKITHLPMKNHVSLSPTF